MTERTIEYRVVAGDGSGLYSTEPTLEDAVDAKRGRDEGYPDKSRGPWVVEQREVGPWRPVPEGETT